MDTIAVIGAAEGAVAIVGGIAVAIKFISSRAASEGAQKERDKSMSKQINDHEARLISQEDRYREMSGDIKVIGANITNLLTGQERIEGHIGKMGEKLDRHIDRGG
jgi:hypothetical protein